MQSDAVRVPGLSHDLQQQITKFDSSEFDVSSLRVDIFKWVQCYISKLTFTKHRFT